MQREEEQMHAEAELLFAALAVLALAPLSMVGERWRRPRSPCTCFSPDYAGRCWCSRSAPLAVMLADRAASAKPSLSPGDTHAPDTQVPESARRACKSLREACQQGWQTPGGRRCAIVKRRTPRGWLPQLSWRTLSLAKHYLYAHTHTHTHTQIHKRVWRWHICCRPEPRGAERERARESEGGRERETERRVDCRLASGAGLGFRFRV